MNKEEALKILATKISEFRSLTFNQLRQKIDQNKDVFEITGTSGVIYYIDIMVIWDDKPKGIIRVMGCIDDGGVRAYFPLSGEGFLIGYDGRFYDEENG